MLININNNTHLVSQMVVEEDATHDSHGLVLDNPVLKLPVNLLEESNNLLAWVLEVSNRNLFQRHHIALALP